MQYGIPVHQPSFATTIATMKTSPPSSSFGIQPISPQRIYQGGSFMGIGPFDD